MNDVAEPSRSQTLVSRPGLSIATYLRCAKTCRALRPWLFTGRPILEFATVQLGDSAQLYDPARRYTPSCPPCAGKRYRGCRQLRSREARTYSALGRGGGPAHAYLHYRGRQSGAQRGRDFLHLAAWTSRFAPGVGTLSRAAFR